MGDQSTQPTSRTTDDATMFEFHRRLVCRSSDHLLGHIALTAGIACILVSVVGCSGTCPAGSVKNGELCRITSTVKESRDGGATMDAGGDAQATDLAQAGAAGSGQASPPEAHPRGGDSGSPGVAGMHAAGSRSSELPLCGNGNLDADMGESCDDTSKSKCPSTCDDGNVCTTDSEDGDAAHCSITCTHTASNSQYCLCGNGTLDAGEACDSSSEHKCPTSCDDGMPCTDDFVAGDPKTCSAACDHSASKTTECLCGNGNRDSGEACDDGPGSAKPCPTDCDDDNECTSDIVTGDAEQCTAKCQHNAITTSSATSKDGCCPQGATIANDADCTAQCGDGVVSAGETCDRGSASEPCPSTCGDDGDACTMDIITGVAMQCTSECKHTGISGCMVVGKYIVNGDNVTDSSTHLTWQLKLPTKYSTCTAVYQINAGNSGEACSRAEARQYCSSLGSGWRLPTVPELKTLVDTTLKPAIGQPFQGTLYAGDFFWATCQGETESMGCFVDFEYGREDGGGVTALRVRCVKG